MVDVYLYQLKHGRYFVHEHSWSASSWHLECIKGLLRQPKVVEIRVDQCAYGLTSQDALGKGLALKPARFVTNAPLIAANLERRCENFLTQVKAH